MPAEYLLLAVRLLAALAIYAFLGSVLLSLWRDLRPSPDATAVAPTAFLLVVDGPEMGRAYRLEAINELGRAADNTIRVLDETVSAYHARLAYVSGQWWLEDLGSRNGTRVNELVVDQPIVVTFGDEISLGRVRFRLEPGDEVEGDAHRGDRARA